MSRATTCTYVKQHHPWSPEELASGKQWIKYALQHYREYVECFNALSPRLAELGQQQGYDWKTLSVWEADLIQRTFNAEQLEECCWRMAVKLHEVVTLLWPDCAEPEWLPFVKRFEQHRALRLRPAADSTPATVSHTPTRKTDAATSPPDCPLTLPSCQTESP